MKPRARAHPLLATAALAAFAAMILCVAKAPATPSASVSADDGKVDVALVLAIDCSHSVDASEHRLQMQGFAAAIESPEVWRAIRSGKRRRIAITVFQWSDIADQRVIVPWTVVETEDKAMRLGGILAEGGRFIPQGDTGMTAALQFGFRLFDHGPVAVRQVIDIATDGRNNMGDPVQRTRDAIVAQDVTINALAIMNDWPDLDTYLEQQVAGGDESFVEKAATYDDFSAAILRKLVREIAGTGTT